MKQLNLERTQAYTFYNKTGGTSLGFKIAKVGKRKKSVFLPKNSATHLEGEVVSYRLSRLLGVSRLFNPVDYYDLGPKAIAWFRKKINLTHRNKWRRFNAGNIKSSLRRNPTSLPGIIKFRHKRRSQAVDQLARSGSFNRRHALATYMRATGARPPVEKIHLRRIRPDKKEFPVPSESAAELARQLSVIFVIDMLTAQGDRFSGGNIEAYAHKKGRLQFVSRDNGGATLEGRWSWYHKYASWVSRFDAPVVQKLMRLNAFLHDNTAPFGTFKTTDELKSVLGFRRDRSFTSFKAKVKHFSEVLVPGLKKRFGNKIYFRGHDALPEPVIDTPVLVSQNTPRTKPRVVARKVAVNEIRRAAVKRSRAKTRVAVVRRTPASSKKARRRTVPRKSKAKKKVSLKRSAKLTKQTAIKRDAAKRKKAKRKVAKRTSAKPAKPKIRVAKRNSAKRSKPKVKAAKASWKKKMFLESGRQ